MDFRGLRENISLKSMYQLHVYFEVRTNASDKNIGEREREKTQKRREHEIKRKRIGDTVKPTKGTATG